MTDTLDMSSAATQTLCSCSDPAVGTHGGEPQCFECLAILTEDDAPETFWRIQNAGLALSRSHRSETWGDEDEGAAEVHEGTSVVEGCAALATANPCIVGIRPDVEIVELEGDVVGRGWDGEPVVAPTRELRRFRGDWETWRRGIPAGCTPEKLVELGWSEVETMDVAE